LVTFSSLTIGEVGLVYDELWGKFEMDWRSCTNIKEAGIGSTDEDGSNLHK
jgi:hypothetical protein